MPVKMLQETAKVPVLSISNCHHSQQLGERTFPKMNIGMYGFKQKQIFKQLVKLLIGTLKEYPYSSVKLVETT